MMTNNRESILNVARDAVQSLIAVDGTNTRAAITLPVSLGSGSDACVVLHSAPSGRFLVTDDALTWFEAELAGVPHRLFARIASKRAESYAARFDGAAMLIMDVSRDHLPTAIVSMANLSKEVYDESVLKLATLKVKDGADAMAEKLRAAFGSKNVHKDADVIGFSGHVYKVDALVEHNQSRIVFEHVTPAGQSVNAAFTKLYDIKQTDTAPRRFIMANKINALARAGYLPLLTQVADAIPDTTPLDKLRAIAA